MYSSNINSTRHYPNQKHFLDPERGLAGHLALAFMYYSEFGFEHPLFSKFWQKGTIAQQAEFISFIGRNLTSSQDQRYIKLLKDSPGKVEDLQKLWESGIHEKVATLIDYLVEHGGPPFWTLKDIFNETVTG